ncbi:hypothetical protein G7Y29_00120 [Corynebacterium qintianiae]|uniref:Uncharacterized protein n=1 Tax=Corynebacterium qintianiae TaxID=2709392 RepID=A0A7T0KNJ0_9CORY|nr:hypothetical protein [Corynebacterium qintianiae]QPK83284.1 hypothetical protein G7Y29_00120 [Corynebacterium qintianiae]
MNPFTIRLAFKGARSAINYFRKLDDDKQREIYDSVLEAIKKEDPEKLNDAYNAARREAGALTRDSHNRLDRHRAAFAAAAPTRAERRKALKQEAKDAKKKSKAGSVFGRLLGLAAAGAAGWAVWEFLLKDKLEQEKKETVTYRVKPREETDARGETTLVYSSRTEDDRDGRETGTVGPLGEEPAERDEELLSSIDEQLTSLDTLDDDQRDATR